MKKKKIKKEISEFLWKKMSNREYTYSKEGLEKLQGDLINFLENLLQRNIIVEIPILKDEELLEKNVKERPKSPFDAVDEYIPEIYVRYITKPKFVILGFGPLTYIEHKKQKPGMINENSKVVGLRIKKIM